ncbi:MAG TPA: hypothetical protein VI603_02905 [Saprospiraceae bacterium]|nr:hypothetical protein [Saprospiraceae bacterium]
MKAKIIALFVLLIGIISVTESTKQVTFYHPGFMENKTSVSFGISTAYAYPPAVGILSNSPNCLSCHVNNGPWKDDANTIIDILDKDTKKSLKQNDGTFLIEAIKGKPKTLLTVIGCMKNNSTPAPYRNAWLYIDTSTIGSNSLSKFAPGWDVNLPMSCRLVGDNLDGYEDANITSLPMTIQPLENAQDAEISLQVMLTKGEATKNKAQEGMSGSYFERKVNLKVK